MNVSSDAGSVLLRDVGVTPALKARLAAVDTWVFDLDNTLYPAGGTLWPMIDERITRYLADLMGIDGMSARGLQKYYYRRYGTTLRGLIEDHRVAPEQFLDFVHDIDRTSLAPNPALVEAIAALPGRKLILTNGSRDHALRTTERLGFLGGAFEAVYDIVASEMIPKPDPAAYDRFFALHDVDPRRAAMVEDLSKNLAVPHARGMVTILVVPAARTRQPRALGAPRRRRAPCRPRHRRPLGFPGRIGVRAGASGLAALLPSGEKVSTRSGDG